MPAKLLLRLPSSGKPCTAFLLRELEAPARMGPPPRHLPFANRTTGTRFSRCSLPLDALTNRPVLLLAVHSQAWPTVWYPGRPAQSTAAPAYLQNCRQLSSRSRCRARGTTRWQPVPHPRDAPPEAGRTGHTPKSSPKSEYSVQSARFSSTVSISPHPSSPISPTPYQPTTAGPTRHTLLFSPLPFPSPPQSSLHSAAEDTTALSSPTCRRLPRVRQE
jgi:hypothetical protein